MILEYLYSDVANLYGDSFNVTVLEQTLKSELTVIRTSVGDEPYFVNHKVDMIYMGSMMERFQPVIIKELLPYKEKLLQLIDDGTVFLITGNAFEIFGQGIDDVKGLGVFDFTTESDYSHHHNSCYLGKLGNIEVVGFKSCFTYSKNCTEPLFITEKGFGFVDDKSKEGIRRNNFFGTYLIGPVLILNPLFTHYLLQQLNMDCPLANEKAMMDAYNYRLKEYKGYEDFKEFKH